MALSDRAANGRVFVAAGLELDRAEHAHRRASSS